MDYHKLLYASLFALGWGIFTTLLVIVFNFDRGKSDEKSKKEK